MRLVFLLPGGAAVLPSVLKCHDHTNTVRSDGKAEAPHTSTTDVLSPGKRVIAFPLGLCSRCTQRAWGQSSRDCTACPANQVPLARVPMANRGFNNLHNNLLIPPKDSGCLYCAKKPRILAWKRMIASPASYLIWIAFINYWSNFAEEFNILWRHIWQEQLVVA